MINAVITIIIIIILILILVTTTCPHLSIPPPSSPHLVPVSG